MNNGGGVQAKKSAEEIFRLRLTTPNVIFRVALYLVDGVVILRPIGFWFAAVHWHVWFWGPKRKWLARVQTNE